MDKNNSKYIKKDSDNADRCANTRRKNNCHLKQKYHGKKQRECYVNIKTDLQLQNVDNKNNL